MIFDSLSYLILSYFTNKIQNYELRRQSLNIISWFGAHNRHSVNVNFLTWGMLRNNEEGIWTIHPRAYKVIVMLL